MYVLTLGFVAGLIGRLGVRWLVARFRKEALAVYLLAGVIGVSLAVLVLAFVVRLADGRTTVEFRLNALC